MALPTNQPNLQIRPPLRSGIRLCVSQTPGHAQVQLSSAKDPSGDPRLFAFDTVVGIGSSQADLYRPLSHVVDGFVEGYNATVFAYGQTGSGKTWSMGSSNTPDTPEHDIGIIPRVTTHIFQKLALRKQVDPKVEFILKVSFIEIYQEQLRDLLVPEVDPRDIFVREDRNGIITLQNVHEEVVKSPEDMLSCLEAGVIERTTAETKMHQDSSRSHAIFTVTLQERIDSSYVTGTDIGDDGETPAPYNVVLRCSKLHLVDLAGSERVKRTGAEGVRLKESVAINTGLLALGNVISALASDLTGGNKSINDKHVPYRDSKLTRLLQDSLGGNAQTVMIACISPTDDNYDETLNTLKYAHRAKKIQNKPVINTVNHTAARLASQQQRIDFLQDRLKRLEEDEVRRLSAPPPPETVASSLAKVAPSPSPLLNPVFAHTGDSIAELSALQPHVQKPLLPTSGSMEDGLWMELRARTIRGTNAIQALKVANSEKFCTYCYNDTQICSNTLNSIDEFLINGGLSRRTPTSRVPSSSNLSNPANQSDEEQQLAHDLAAAVRSKGEIARELTRVNKDVERARHQHAEQIYKLEKDLDAAQLEISRLRYEARDRDLAKEKMKEDYERKVRLVEGQLSKLKARQKEFDRVSRDNDQNDRRMTDLQSDMDKLKEQLAVFKKKQKDDAEKLTELDLRRSKEVAAYVKQHEDDGKKIRSLEAQIEMLRKKLDRCRTDEVASRSKSRSESGKRKSVSGVGNEAEMTTSDSTCTEAVTMTQEGAAMFDTMIKMAGADDHAVEILTRLKYSSIQEARIVAASLLRDVVEMRRREVEVAQQAPPMLSLQNTVTSIDCQIQTDTTNEKDLQVENTAMKVRLKEVTAANQRLGKALERQKERALMVKEALTAQRKLAPELAVALSGLSVKHIPATGA
ncbi:hypothetical protein SeMB42_g04027 [Synchytrium endobioticum]|uniref:Kinesin-like protein n=1 Tax=Synchytrium endobioticum TaxID=286115 RepID=A0A507D1R9_9FUNG|nr:hypothetical protein SeMB42_g04027 [Synchytrium endobioticum]